MLKAVVFDLDGTLLDSMHVWDHVAESYLTSLGKTAKDGLQEVLTPMSLTQSSIYLKEEYRLTQDIAAIQQGIEAVVLAKYEQELQLKEGVKECLHDCKKRGLSLGVVTASSYAMTHAALTRNGVWDMFDSIMTCEQAKAAKNDPIIYERTLKQLHVDKKECIFVDDALYALKAMKQAGCIAYAVYDEANAAQWDKICEISDAHFRKIAQWEVEKTCRKF